MLSFSKTVIRKKFRTLKVGSLAGREARSQAGITIYDQGNVVFCLNVVFLKVLSFSNTEISKKFGTLKVGSLAGREARSGAGITIYDQGKNNVLSACSEPKLYHQLNLHRLTGGR